MTSIKTIVAGTCALLLAAAPTARAQGPAAADREILAAKEAAQRGQWKVLESYKARLAGHPLEAYPAYWLMAGSVEHADPREVRAFLDRYADSPLAESLRREWLKALGAAQAWEPFRAEYPRMVGEDVEVTCYAFQERSARADADVAAEARTLFVSGRDGAPSCEPVFAALAASKAIGEAEMWARVRRLLAAGNLKEAKRASALIDARHRIAEKTLDRASRDPAAVLAQQASSRNPDRATRELVVFAIGRLARSKPDEAAAKLATWSGRIGVEATQFAWGQVALQGALVHDARALEWYAKADGTALDDTQNAWRARAALRSGDWGQVLSAIKSLSPEEAREPVWRYWRARALRSLGAPEAASQLLATLAKEPQFYGLLAAEDLGLASAPDWNGWQPAGADLDRVRSLGGIQRALELYRVGLYPEGAREWLWAIRGLDDIDLLAAAEIARGANVPDRAINTADRTLAVHDFAQRFPTPHRDTFGAAARRFDLDEAIVYGLVRQESRFVAEARSPMGAMGLMQLMPATARWVAKQIDVRSFKPQMLVRPELNVQMGTYYLHRVMLDLGHPVLATAAYNAGPGRARRWRGDHALEGAIYAETIPFNETRDYVKKVFANAWYYHHRFTGQMASLREMLGMVPAASGGAAEVASNLP